MNKLHDLMHTSKPLLSRSICILLLMLCQESYSDTLRIDLSKCIMLAKRDGASARSKRLEFASQKFDYDAQRADFYPQVQLSAYLPGYSRAIVPVLQPDGTYLNVSQTQTYSDASLSLSQKIPFTGGDLTLSSSLNNRINLGTERTEFWQSTPMNIQLRQPLFGVNQYSYTRRINELRYSAAARAFLEQMEDVAIEATARFFDYYIACMNVDNAQFNIAINDSIYTLAKGRYNVGKIAENDLLQSELAVLSSTMDFERARLLRQRSLAALQLSLGVTEGTYIVVNPPLVLPTFSIDAALAISAAMKNRSDITSLEIQKLESQRDVDQAQVNNLFNASITASYGTNQSALDFNRAYKSPLDQERLSLNLEMPLVSWSKFSSLVESARAQQQRIDVQNTMRFTQLKQELEFEIKDFVQLQQLVSIADKSQQIALRRYEVARNRYIIGKIETTELMLSQREKDDARRSFYSTLRDYWTAYYRIRKITLYDFELKKVIDVDSD